MPGSKSWIMAGGVAGIVLFLLLIGSICLLSFLVYFFFIAPK